MAKTYVDTVKYLIKAMFDVAGIVDKHDVIGAVFGQCEGLLGEAMDLKELQSTGRIGRIEANLNSNKGKTTGILSIPSSLDMIETSIMAAAIETVDKVGPCKASFKVQNISDIRINKRKEIEDRAAELLQRFLQNEVPEPQELAERVRSKIRVADLQSYGRDKLACGPEIFKSETIIICEGRADVLNLLRHNIKNVIGMDGSKISNDLIDLTKRKTTILFVDGDRGGELIARKVMDLADIDYLARAPDGKEVEELTKKEILTALKRKMPITQSKTGQQVVQELKEENARQSKEIKLKEKNQENKKRIERTTEKPWKFKERTWTKGIERPSMNTPIERKSFNMKTRNEIEKASNLLKKEELNEKEKKIMNKINGKLKASLLNEKEEEISEISIKDLIKSLDETKKIEKIIMDGIITQRLINKASEKKIKKIIGVNAKNIKEEKGIKIIIV